MSVGYGQSKVIVLVTQLMSHPTEHADLPEISNRGIKFGYTPDVLTGAGTLLTSPEDA